jgi:p-hydroxybenzoate 3-monooxygenase
MRREGMVHRGLRLRFGGRSHRIDLHGLTGGRTITVYGQQEVVKDLIAARLAAGGQVLFDVSDVRLDGLTDRPVVRFRQDGRERELACAAIAGCDGFHGVCRDHVPAGALRVHERTWPYAWLGVLAQAPPSGEELVYAAHERGFALHSMRTPEITRLYLQVPPDTPLDEWPDERIWAELRARLDGEGFTLAEGPILERGVTGMRAFVAEPMRHGRLFLAGDAAHIVPPTGAKGLNLAVADVRLLAEALTAWLRRRDDRLVDAYSARCLRRVWRVQHFSSWMTRLLHTDPAGGGSAGAFDARVRRSELEYVVRSEAAARTLAENYVGLPFDWETSAGEASRG